MKLLKPEEGYKYFAPYYKFQYEYLDSFDWEKSKELLFKNIDDIYITKEEIIIGDLGCGDARILKRVEGYLKKKGYLNYKLFGLDISSEMLKIARKKIKEKVEFIKTDIEKDSLPCEFDLIYSFFLLVHIKDIDQLFQKVYFSLKTDGKLIFNNIEQKRGFRLPFIKEETYIEFHNHSDIKVIDRLKRYFNYYKIIETDFSSLFICEK